MQNYYVISYQFPGLLEIILERTRSRASQLITRYQTASIKQEISEEKAEKRNNPGKKYLILPEDSATLSLDLANDFPEAEESQIRHKESTPKNIQAEDRQSNNEMMEMLKYMNQRQHP